jgi:hypothetical protein
LGSRAMIASDITSNLGEAFISVGGDAERIAGPRDCGIE